MSCKLHQLIFAVLLEGNDSSPDSRRNFKYWTFLWLGLFQQSQLPYRSEDPVIADSCPFPRENVEPPPCTTRLAYMLRIVVSISFSKFWRYRSAANTMSSHSSLRPSKIRSKTRASVKLLAVYSSSSRVWNTCKRTSYISWSRFPY